MRACVYLGASLHSMPLHGCFAWSLRVPLVSMFMHDPLMKLHPAKLNFMNQWSLRVPEDDSDAHIVPLTSAHTFPEYRKRDILETETRDAEQRRRRIDLSVFGRAASNSYADTRHLQVLPNFTTTSLLDSFIIMIQLLSSTTATSPDLVTYLKTSLLDRR